MKRISAIFAVLACLVCADADAQAPNPVMEHYRAYQAALERDELETAEREAAAALAASEARDGDGGSTAVLALNLASVRLMRGDAAGARQPGLRSYRLAEANPDLGVNPALAALIVARAQVANGDSEGIDNLASALTAAQRANVARSEIFDAAVALGHAAFAGRHFPTSRDAWRVAAAYAEGSRFPASFAAANARTGEAAAMLMQAINESRRTRDRELDEAVARDLYLMFQSSVRQLAPLAQADAPDGGVTYAQRAYGEALAWRGVLGAKMRSDNQNIPTTDAQDDTVAEVAIGAAAMRPCCLVELTPSSPMPRYPPEALEDGNLAGLAVRLRLNAQGEVIESQTIARIGHADFAGAVERAAQRWRFRAREGSPPDCRMEMIFIMPVTFAIGR